MEFSEVAEIRFNPDDDGYSSEVNATIVALTCYVQQATEKKEDVLSLQFLGICANYINPEKYPLHSALERTSTTQFQESLSFFVKEENGEFILDELTVLAFKYVENHPGTSESLEKFLKFLRTKIG